ncbi:MAG: radical SAM protein [Armatimonadetes bacterium]|nr:radical SAM protein [Armatimonadota bacterium]NIM24190.1 radical SAM protein [Armatimonadota bacterium]NIM68055.1 radical SAM protein [Armatimonadota bacterium]NIM76089.1 radical SAM protein [Armatimonadota bacterium]NIN05760.1 radical SAM protein [Armatimonadota bacterium]
MDLEQISEALQQLSQEDMGELSRRMVTAVRQSEFQPTNTVDLFITQACNLRCDYCFVGRKKPRHATEEQLHRAVDFVLKESANAKQVKFVLFGGEPLLRKDLVRSVAEYSRRRGRETGKQVIFELTTNGTLIDDDALELAHEFGFNYLISIDGDRCSHDLHRKMPDGSGSFDTIVDKIPLVQRWDGHGAAGRVTVNPDTIGRLARGIRELVEIGFTFFLIAANEDVTWSREDLDEYGRQLEEVARFYIKVNEKERRVQIPTFMEPLEVKQKRFTHLWGCHAGRGRLAIDCDGRIFPCARFAGLQDDEGVYQLGTLEDGITEWAARRRVSYDDPQTRYHCLACEYHEYCTGGCPATSFQNCGSVFRPTEVFCAVAKTTLKILKEMPEVAQIWPLPTEAPYEKADSCETEAPSGGQPELEGEHIQPIS